MIAFLRGVVIGYENDEVILMVGGVGYRVHLAASNADGMVDLLMNTSVELRIREIVREDAFDLYGFFTAAEEKMFLKLVAVKQVGPKTAARILRSLGWVALDRAVTDMDVRPLTRVRGVGAKTAAAILKALA